MFKPENSHLSGKKTTTNCPFGNLKVVKGCLQNVMHLANTVSHTASVYFSQHSNGIKNGSGSTKIICQIDLQRFLNVQSHNLFSLWSRFLIVLCITMPKHTLITDLRSWFFFPSTCQEVSFSSCKQCLSLLLQSCQLRWFPFLCSLYGNLDSQWKVIRCRIFISLPGREAEALPLTSCSRHLRLMRDMWLILRPRGWFSTVLTIMSE